MGEFETEFSYSEAIPHEEGVSRRDPSPVVRIGSTYHVWYSKTAHDPSGYFATVWHATSEDGRTWAERGEAIPTGADDAWDANGVFTPTTLLAEGKVWLFYTAVPKPFTNDDPEPTKTAIGAAFAHSPDGPWTKFDGNPVLRPADDPDEFDSLRVDDACLIVRDGRTWLYYKGRQMRRTPGETKTGVAFADAPAGPYVRYEGNPVIGSGHEVCVWPHGTGVGALVAPCGPEGNTCQWSADGLHFEVKAAVQPPSAPGPYRADAYEDVVWGDGITWGLCQRFTRGRWPFLARFDCDLRAAR